MEAYVRSVSGQDVRWRLLRLTGSHDASAKNKLQNRMIELGREFHANLLFWKWAIDHELLLEGEALSTPCYTAIKRPVRRHYYLSDASFEAVAGFFAEKKVFWRYDLPTELTAESKRKADQSRPSADLYHHNEPPRVIWNGRVHV